jgi:hypothetical protein
MSTLADLPANMLHAGGPRLPAVTEWLTRSVWSPGRFASLPREEYLRDGEASVARVEEVISAGAGRLWDELAAASEQAPTPRAFLGLDSPPSSQPIARAVVVFDGLSLRELPLLLDLAAKTGFRIDDSRAIVTSLPTETIDFVSQRIVGPDAAHGTGPNQLPASGALTSRGVHAAYLDSLTPRLPLPAGKSLLLWSTYPDRLFKDDEARFDTQLFPQFSEYVSTLWKYTVQAIPPGVPIVITSDHGYIFFGSTAESGRDSNALDLLAQQRHRIFPEAEAFPRQHPDLQLFPARRLAMLRGRLKTRPKGNGARRLYQHGGFSLMETLVPWVLLNRA